MTASRTKIAVNSPDTEKADMAALALLRDEPRREVIASRVRKFGSAKQGARATGLSERHTKALRDAEHDPHLDTACRLARKDHVIRAKIIIDCLPDDLALKVAHLKWNDLDDMAEFYRAVARSIIGEIE